MKKPDDIDQSAWDTAKQVWAGTCSPQPLDIEDIARFILAVRERCAVIADVATFDSHALEQATEFGRGKHAAAVEIAAAIRKGAQ